MTLIKFSEGWAKILGARLRSSSRCPAQPGGSGGGATTAAATGCGTLTASTATVAVARRNWSLTSDAGNLVETSASATAVPARAERSRIVTAGDGHRGDQRAGEEEKSHQSCFCHDGSSRGAALPFSEGAP